MTFGRPAATIEQCPQGNQTTKQPRVPYPAAKRIIAWFAVGTSPVSTACTAELPPVVIELSSHDNCDNDTTPVDASAATIECWVDDFLWRIDDGSPNGETIKDQGSDVAGVPVCCEVCAAKTTADDACADTCTAALCNRAFDDHLNMAYELSDGIGTLCENPLTCGFSMPSCLSGFTWPQDINFANDDLDSSYALLAKCQAHALNAARPDGLFSYVEELNGVPGGGETLADVEDVVEWCLGSPATGGGAGGGGGGGGADDGADSSGGMTAGGTAGGGGPPSPTQGIPDPCGPFAEQRYWVRPTNNYATWNAAGTSAEAEDGNTTYTMNVTSGGLEYTVIRCATGTCIRLDRLSATFEESSSSFGVALNQRRPSDLLALAVDDTFEIPAGHLDFAARYTLNGVEVLVEASNAGAVDGTIDRATGTFTLKEFAATSTSGNQTATVLLKGDLSNTQPEPHIDVATSAWNQVSLSAMTTDAEGDPITHRWLIPGVGEWNGDRLDVTLPKGRHPVVLFADDVHRSRGIDATWVTITEPGS